MEIYKCRICGDPYVGSSKPSHCPFCGAPDKYIILAKDWQDPNEGLELSEVSRANLEHALMVENNNALFYDCAFEVAVSVELGAMFKALSKVEAEHASVVAKMLGMQKADWQVGEDNRGRCHALELSNISESLNREKRAIDFYARAAEVATEPRVKEVFTALVEIENTHIELGKKVLETFGGVVEGTITG